MDILDSIEFNPAVEQYVGCVKETESTFDQVLQIYLSFFDI